MLLEDKAFLQSPVADECLTLNGVLLRHLPPYSPNLSFIEPNFAEYERNVRDMSYHHPELPDRLTQVLAFASTPLVSIQGYYWETRRKLWWHLSEMAGPGRPLQVVLPALPIELAPPQPRR